jgi:hypothetical protein
MPLQFGNGEQPRSSGTPQRRTEVIWSTGDLVNGRDLSAKSIRRGYSPPGAYITGGKAWMPKASSINHIDGHAGPSPQGHSK